ncbi:MAG: hypothetical protein ACOCSE_01335 [Chitinivibrionales bacterium]
MSDVKCSGFHGLPQGGLPGGVISCSSYIKDALSAHPCAESAAVTA